MQIKEPTKAEQQDKTRKALAQKAICELAGQISDERSLEMIYRLVLFTWKMEG